MPKRYKIYTLLSRLFMTLFMLVLAWFGARSWTVTGIMVLVGLILDVIRNKLAPELAGDLNELAAKHRMAATPGPQSWRDYIDCHILIYFGPFALYTLTLITIDSFAGSDSLTRYLGLFAPLHEVASAFMSMSRRHSAQLIAMGYANRVDLAVHLYSIAGVTIIIGTFSMTLAVHKWLIESARIMANQGKDALQFFYKAQPRLRSLYAITLVMYWFWSSFMDVRTSGRWNIEISNMPYLILVAWAAFIATFSALIYLSFLRIRLQMLAASTSENLGLKSPA